MPVRVALDATPLLGARTGVGRFVHGATAALARRPDVDLRAYGLTWRGRGDVAAQLPAGVTLARLPMAAGPLLRIWARADIPAAEWWTGGVDVVHGTNFVVPPARRAAEVVTVHDLTAVRFPQLCTPTARGYPQLVRRALARGAFVHAPSAAVAAEVVELLGADAGRVVTVHHGVDAPPVARAPSARPTVLALGTVEPRKDLPLLVAAFDQLADHHADVQLVIAGPDGWGAGQLDEALARARHRQRIERLGWVDEPARHALLSTAAVFAYPSIYEGFGFPPLEAMAAGVPVVATAAGALPEVLGDGATLVGPGDAEGLAHALATVIEEDDAAAADRVARGRHRAATFTWERAAAGLVALYGAASGDR